MKTISLKLSRKTVSVLLDDKPHTLTELTGAQRDEYLNFTGTRMKTDDKGKPVGIADYTGFQSKLVALSLTDENGKHIPEETIKAWPAAAVQELFNAAQELSGLGDKTEAASDAAKNA